MQADHQNQQQTDLSDEFKLFIDEKYPGCNWRHLIVQTNFLSAVLAEVEISKEKTEEIIETSLSIIEHLSMHPDSSICSSKFEALKTDILSLIGEIRLKQDNRTEDEAKKCLSFLDDLKKTRESLGNAAGVAQLDIKIAHHKARSSPSYSYHILHSNSNQTCIVCLSLNCHRYRLN